MLGLQPGTQQRSVWFDPTKDRKYPELPHRPTDDEVRWLVNEANPNYPLNRVICSERNRGNLETLRKFHFTCFKRSDHSARGCNFGIYCPPGQGKTFIVKAFAEALQIPFVFVQSPMLNSTYHLFTLIQEACRKHGTPLTLMKGPQTDVTLPPIVIFFDEAHALKKDLMKGALLNAMEPDDAMMRVKRSPQSADEIVVDMHNVCWIAATTERGDLFDAFESRLSTAIKWSPAGDEELPVIIKAGLDAKYNNKELPFSPDIDVCRLIARYQKVPRLAIHGFGTKVVQHRDYNPRCSWEEACEIVAKEIGIDEWGLTVNQVKILTALGQRPLAEHRLDTVCDCRITEIQRFDLPGLQQHHNGGPYVVSVSGKGMCLTEAGLKQLDKRGISHGGERVTAEYFESRR